MDTFLKPYLQFLKASVIKNFNSRQIQPGDCYELSNAIKKKTDKSISETTLKRFFGFTNCVHKPSIYTLTALSNFSDYISWEEFMKSVDALDINKSPLKDWHSIRLTTSKSTFFNSHVIKRKARIGTDNIIYRYWTDSFFKEFENSNYNKAIIFGPASSGKSLAVSQWAETQINKKKNDIILYLDKLSLIQSAIYGYHPHIWLAKVLNLQNEVEIEEFLKKHQGNPNGNIHLIIDGFNRITGSDTLFFSIIENLFDIIDHYSTFPTLYFTLIMRTDVYLKVQTHFGKNWSLQKIFASKSNRGIRHEFQSTELTEFFIKQKLDHFIPELMSKPDTDLLKFPYRTQLFIQYNNQENLIDFHTEGVKYHLIHDQFHEIIDEVLLSKDNKVLAYSFFKMAHLGFIRSGKNKNYQKFQDIKPRFLNCLYELIGNGILVPQQVTERDSAYKFESELIESFVVSYYTYHTLKNPDFDLFIQTLVQEKIDLSLYHTAARWFIFFKVNDSDYSYMKSENQNLNQYINKEEAMISTFYFFDHTFSALKDQQEKQQKLEPLIKSPWPKYILTQACFENSDWLLICQAVCKHYYSSKHKVELSFRLSMYSLFKWDIISFMDQLEIIQNELKSNRIKIQTPSGQLINPIGCMSIIFQYIKYGKINHDLIKESIYQNRLQNSDYIASDYILFDVLVYIVLFIADDKQMCNQFLVSLQERNLKEIEGDERIVHNLLMQLCKGTEDPNILGKKLDFKFMKPTTFMEILALCLSLQLFIKNGSYGIDVEKIKQTIQSTDLNNYRLLKNYFLKIWPKKMN